MQKTRLCHHYQIKTKFKNTVNHNLSSRENNKDPVLRRGGVEIVITTYITLI